MPQMSQIMAEEIMRRVVGPLLEQLCQQCDVDDQEREERLAAAKQEVEDCIDGAVGRVWS